MISARVLVICALAASCVATEDLPSWFKTCKKETTDLNACFVKIGNEVFKQLAKGVPALGIPVLSPLKHPGLKFTSKDGFSFELKESNAYGVETLEITDAQVDLKEQTIKMTYHYPKAEWKGTYEMKTLDQTDSVTGKANIAFNNVTFVYTMTYDVKEDGHAQVSASTCRIEHPDIDFNLENYESKEKFRSLKKEFSDLFVEDTASATNQFVSFMFNNVFKVAKIDELFPVSS